MMDFNKIAIVFSFSWQVSEACQVEMQQMKFSFKRDRHCLQVDIWQPLHSTFHIGIRNMEHHQLFQDRLFN